MTNRNVYLAIDSDNLLYSVPSGWQVDYEALLNLARRLGVAIEAAVYASRSNGIEKDRENLLDLKRMGYTRLITRPLRLRPDGTRKSDVDVALAVDIWEAALAGRIDTVILVSGDSDFIPLVDRLVQRGLEVYLVGPDNATAWELAVAATQFCYASAVDGLLNEQPVETSTPVREHAHAA